MEDVLSAMSASRQNYSTRYITDNLIKVCYFCIIMQGVNLPIKLLSMDNFIINVKFGRIKGYILLRGEMEK